MYLLTRRGIAEKARATARFLDRTVAEATSRLLRQWQPQGGATGTFHLSAAGHIDRYGFAIEVLDWLRELGDECLHAKVRPVSSADYKLPAVRPRFCVLDNGKIERAFGIRLENWRADLGVCLRSRVIPQCSGGES